MATTNSLTEAIITATYAHEGQKDKGGEVYILHPIRVMLKFEAWDNVYRIVAVLHDVVEDTHITLDMLRNRFSKEVVEAVDALTRREDEEDYFVFINRCKGNPIAREVKMADILDNLAPGRDREAQERLREKYEKALDILMEANAKIG